MSPRSRRHSGDHPRRRTLRGHGYFKRLGPGLVTGAADDDPSGIGTYSQVGAQFGLRFTWCALYVLPMAIAVQETAARLGLVTGQGLAALIRRRYSRPVLFGAALLVAAANTFNIAADLASMGAAARLLVPVPSLLLIVAFTALTLALEILVPYHQYARVLRWFAISLFAYVAVLLSVRVPWGDVLRRTAIPSIGFDRTDLAALLAIFGTTVSPYLFFWQASEEAEEQGPRQRVTMRDIIAMRVDVIAGMGSGVFVMFAIITAGAVTLNAHGMTRIATADQAAEALKPFAGNLAGLVFAAGIVGLGLLSVPVLAGSTAYALSEALGWSEGLSRAFRSARGFYLVIVGSLVGGLIIQLIGVDPIQGLFVAAILNGVAAPPLILLMALLARDASIVGNRRSGWWSFATMLVTFALSAALPILWFAAR